MASVGQQSFPLSFLPPNDILISWCDRERTHGDSGRFLIYPSQENPQAFIKYGSKDMLSEAENQKYAFQALKQLPREEKFQVRIPEIYRVIEYYGTVYIVMEYIPGKTFKDILDQHTATKEHFNRIAEAIKLFLRLEIQYNTPPGPIGKGIIRHPLFKDTYASIEYQSTIELERHINMVANVYPGNNLKIDFSKEKLCFCFSDLFEGNFIFTARALYIIDFEHASILPESFMTYALNQDRPICQAIKDQFLLPQKNLEPMKTVGHYFMIFSRTVGKYTALYCPLHTN